MKIAELLETRRTSWGELETMCNALDASRFPYVGQGSQIARFSALYRAACTDLSMADQYQLPPTTVEYLHRLVGRAHSQLYRSHRFPLESMWTYFWVTAPQAVFRDPCVKVAFVIFFGLFTLSALLAYFDRTFPNYPERVVGREQLEEMEKSFSQPIGTDENQRVGNMSHYIIASAGYIQHNTTIGLQCFALGPLLLPSICTLGFNAVSLGACFGYMARADVKSGDNFLQFVTAHGVFELTAIALSAGAGMRLGVGVFLTRGMARLESFRLSALRALPIILASVTLFIMAAFTEGFISPSPLPYIVKVLVAVVSSGLLMFYFVILGYPRQNQASLEKELLQRIEN